MHAGNVLNAPIYALKYAGMYNVNWRQNALEPRVIQYSAVTCFFLREVKAKSLELFWQDFIE